jgi:hypothetical protein
MGVMDLLYALINRRAVRKVERSFKPYTQVRKDQEPALLVSGAFRSGTSVTALLLSNAGYDLGPQHHLLQSTGKYAQYNPDGFLENYFFMELTRYIFHLTGSAGDRPPSRENVDKVLSAALRDEDFREHAIMELRESRVSNRNKADVLSKASVQHVNAYISNAFGKKPLIKNPHFSVLPSFTEKYFPQSKQVVVFRNPDSWHRSALAVTPNANTELYKSYYENYLNAGVEHVIFFDYDRLLAEPQRSVQQLFDALHIADADVNALTKLIRNKDSEACQRYYPLYAELQKRAINA